MGIKEDNLWNGTLHRQRHTLVFSIDVDQQFEHAHFFQTVVMAIAFSGRLHGLHLLKCTHPSYPQMKIEHNFLHP